MKKIAVLKLTGGACILFFGIFIMNSCKKDNDLTIPSSSSMNSPNERTENFNEKSSSQKSNAFLISAIHGDDPEFQNLENLEYLLMQNAPLSSPVISSLINTDRVTDDIVELGMVLASSISNGDLNSLSVKRPLLNQQSILQARDAEDKTDFRVVFTSPRSVIFGSDIERKQKEDGSCTDCSSEIRASNGTLIQLTTNVVSKIAIKCLPTKNQICGRASYVLLESQDGKIKIFNVICQASDEICIFGSAH